VISNNIAPPEEGQDEQPSVTQLSQDDNKSFNWIAFQ
jgi:hypothetical protein